MAQEYRWQQNNAYGTLSQAAASSAPTLVSAGFTSLPPVSGSGAYIPIVLRDNALNIYELAWITAHVANSDTITVLRGQEDLPALAWPTGTAWVCAPTTWDFTRLLQSTAVPATAPLGARGAMSDLNEVLEKTYAQGWQGYARQRRADTGRTLGNSTVPAGYSVLKRSLTANGTSDANGYLAVALPNGGFPNGLVSAVYSPVFASGGTAYIPRTDQVLSTKSTLQVNCQLTNSTSWANAGVTFGVEATGW